MVHKKNKSKKAKSAKQQPRPGTNAVVSAPVQKSFRTTKRPPSIWQTTRNSVRISNSEYIADITSASPNFSITSFPINPGLASTFPWLCLVATRFESYIFESLEFEYKPICPTSEPGKVILAVDFDAADPPPSSKIQIGMYQDAASTSPWDSCVYRCTKANLHKFMPQRYVRGGGNTGDVKTYDTGNMFVATQNTADGTRTLGELWVHYTVRLATPQITATTTDRTSGEETYAPSQWSQVLRDGAGTYSAIHQFIDRPNLLLSKVVDGAVIAELNPANPTMLFTAQHDQETVFKPADYDPGLRIVKAVASDSQLPLFKFARHPMFTNMVLKAVPNQVGADYNRLSDIAQLVFKLDTLSKFDFQMHGIGVPISYNSSRVFSLDNLKIPKLREGLVEWAKAIPNMGRSRLSNTFCLQTQNDDGTFSQEIVDEPTVRRHLELFDMDLDEITSVQSSSSRTFKYVK